MLALNSLLKPWFIFFYIDSKQLEILSHCLSMECKPTSQFRDIYCNEFLAAICNNKRQGRSMAFHFIKTISPTHHQNHLPVAFLRRNTGFIIRIFLRFYVCQKEIPIYWLYFCFIAAENLYKNDRVSLPWEKTSKACKMKDYYLLGNINLSDVNSACKDQENLDPRWIGVVKENYVKSDQGNTNAIEGIIGVAHDVLFWLQWLSVQ